MVAHSIPVESRPPVAHTTAPFPPGVVFRKTAAGRQTLAARRSALGLRERQILILCTGERGLEALSEVFGSEAEADLSRLIDQGLVKVGARTVWPVGGAVDAFGPTLQPLADAADRSANQSGFQPTLQEFNAWWAAHTQASAQLRAMGDANALQLLQTHRGARHADDVLVYLALTLVAVSQCRGLSPALDWVEQLGRALPDGAVPKLLDCLIDTGSPELIAGVYERLLSDSELRDDVQR